MYKRVWMVKVSRGGYDLVLFFEGTEAELRAYLDSELLQYFDTYHYRGANEQEVAAAKSLGMKIYLV